MATESPAKPKPVDLVLSGGGVKGVGLVGAVVALMDAGYSVKRVSGVSAGSLVGSILAAASNGDQLTTAQIKEMALTLPYPKFRDAGPAGHLPVVGQAWGLVRDSGIYRGDFAHQWIRSELKNLGVTKFGDLALNDKQMPEERRYRLAVTVTDITTGQLVRLPWDYRRIYGLDPDEQVVADAVRASMSIPFYFRPVTLTSADGLTSTLVDGGVLSNFPIDSFDRLDGKPPRWPTFGITVLPNLPEGNDQVIPGIGALRLLGPPSVLLEQLITTMFVGRDQTYLNQPWVSARAIRVDSTAVNFLDFNISRTDATALFGKGYKAAEAFLSTWNWVKYLERFRQYH
ncbi:phospholipase [Mycobacterium intermedium]|uniref:Phospholipase n=1 Tax=Mycobacterium intermedium TaxID=28445 RepID=A0A1E3S7R5_MYCIE|nr:patatin-like phospholipase family protein [Mycobacterium intermedium]MCV6966119.1 patatin-like phospholipase family protein [Mycobacterium intermedium]ODQ98205.1 phospholipase [Mycobacterium intermedium]OPE50164.1 phospholipase [Mycobacterium intermedium]ORA95430.1 phospholipase [Mycobacterium intermedium]